MALSMSVLMPHLYSSCPSINSRVLISLSSRIPFISPGVTLFASRPSCCSIIIFSICLFVRTRFREMWKTKSNFFSSSAVPSAQLIARCSWLWICPFLLQLKIKKMALFQDKNCFLTLIPLSIRCKTNKQTNNKSKLGTLYKYPDRSIFP